MKAICTLIFVLLAGTAYGQSKLRPCAGLDKTLWGSCFGTFIYNANNQLKGSKYVGEFNGPSFDGQGTLFRVDGSIGLGEWKSDKPHGKFIEYRADGSIERSGIFVNGKLTQPQYIDPNSFTSISRNSTAPAVSDSPRQTIAIATETCERTYQLIDSLKKIHCLDKFSISKKIIKNHNKTLIDLVKNSLCWSLAIPTEASCNIIGFSSAWPSHCGMSLTMELRNKEALDRCEVTGCKCSLVISSNDIVDDQLFFSYATPDINLVVKDNTLKKIGPDINKNFESENKQLVNKPSGLSILVTNTNPDLNGEFTLNIKVDSILKNLKVNNKEIPVSQDFFYKLNRLATIGQESHFVVEAEDINGNKANQTLSVMRKLNLSNTVFAELSPLDIVKSNKKDAVAILIGIEKYKNLPKADFANSDARVFYDYAIRALGIDPENIKLLVDQDAEQAEILRTLKSWLPARVRPSTNIFLYYSGHGLPTSDGKGLYLLPVGADKDFVDRTSLLQAEINSLLQAAKAKSVTIFLDSCYSGTGRTGETIVANARPISLKLSESVFPPEFNVISASQNDQISSSSPDLKHGIFSYYLMKGMEGDADINKDGIVSFGEMHSYLTEKVTKHSSMDNRIQIPQFLGDPNKVLISR